MPAAFDPSDAAPVGVRAALPDGAMGIRRLRWVRPGALVLATGDRVVVAERGEHWLGVVVVPSGRVVEWPHDIDGQDRPTVERLATADEWPAAAPTDGGRLLASLNLPESLLRRPV